MKPATHQLKHAAVIGAGIAGLSCALELQRRGYEVTLYDQHIPTSPDDYANITSAAASQFLPFLYSGVDAATEKRILAFAAESRKVYERLARLPLETGVMPIRNVELVNDENDWPPGLVKTMRASKHRLETPVMLKTRQPQRTYTAYYEFDTFSIKPSVLLFHLLGRFLEHGGKTVQQKITKATLYGFDCPVIQAAGIDGPTLANDTHVDFYKGYTIAYQPDKPIPPVAISVDDLIIIPHADGGFAVGALHMHKPESHEPEASERAELLLATKELSRLNIGHFHALPEASFARPIRDRVAHRVSAPDSPIIEKDPLHPNIVHNYAYGSVGCTTAFGGAIAAVDLLLGA